MSYPRQLAKRTCFTEIVPDPTVPDDLTPTCRFPTESNSDERISHPSKLNDHPPIDAVDERVIASGLLRISKIEQYQTESNPLTTVLLRCN